MAWGTGTTVEDAEVYGGSPEDDVNLSKFSPEETTPEEPYVTASSSQPLNQQKFSNRFSFYLDEDIGQFGVRYNDSPFSANLNIGQGGQTNWGMQLGGGTGLLNANVGVAGQGTSGSLSPWGNLSTEPIPGLTFSVGAHKNPGMNFNMTGPSLNYQQQFKTPIGPLDLSLDKRYGGDLTGMLRYQKDW